MLVCVGGVCVSLCVYVCVCVCMCVRARARVCVCAYRFAESSSRQPYQEEKEREKKREKVREEMACRRATHAGSWYKSDAKGIRTHTQLSTHTKHTLNTLSTR